MSESAAATRPTRGAGLLEGFLARQRARQANRLIPSRLRGGRILDVGCGSFPYFLSHTSFREKLAIERRRPPDAPEGIEWHELDLNRDAELPFEDGHVDVVTMLAVIEHLDPSALEGLLAEVHRVLAPGGRLIITTPAAWSDPLLRWMAGVGLVSAEEIDEHAFAYTHSLIGWYFGRAAFRRDGVRFGYFEMRLNLWATADR